MVLAVLLSISAFLCSCKAEETITESNIPVKNNNTGQPPVSGTVQEVTDESKTNHPVVLSEKTLIINGRENHVFLLEVDIENKSVVLTPYLSFGKVYGYETLTEMVGKTGAYAAVNGGFFFEYGQPSGLVVINGEVISPGTGKYKSIIIEDGRVKFEKVKTEIVLIAETGTIKIDSFNKPPDKGVFALFSGYYGATDRLNYLRNILVIENGIVTECRKTKESVSIPPGGYVVSIPADYENISEFKGIEMSVDFSPSFEKGTMAYEGASMLVKDGESMAGDIMPWVGNMNHYDPRTCIGVMENGRIGLVVIDGRQTGYSSGTTGRETADLLINLGFTDAFMLDGGASSEMIFNGEIVNIPSDKGIERILAGGILVMIVE